MAASTNYWTICKSSVGENENLRKLDVSEVEEAELIPFQQIQHDLFAKEFSDRLENFTLDNDKTKPIILKTHHITQLLVQHYQEQCQHFDEDIVINNLRQTF